jgi:S-(hydroxymethyl)glutathione dehydrogenase/alcohol dehydrogenase
VSAYPIIGIDLHQQKLDMGKKFGLTHGILAGSDDLSDDITTIIGDLADIVIETTGNSRVIEQAYNLTHPDGKTILVGVPNKGDNISIYSLPLHFNKVLTGSHGGDAVPDVEIPRLMRLIEAKKMTLDGLITHEFPLEDINNALDLFRSGEAGRIILNLKDH